MLKLLTQMSTRLSSWRLRRGGLLPKDRKVKAMRFEVAINSPPGQDIHESTMAFEYKIVKTNIAPAE